MTTPTSFSGTGLSISVFMPLVIGGTYLKSLTEDVNSYQHSTAADGGYISASFDIAGERNIIEDWIAYGLGRHIEVLSPSGVIVWEGFVNQIDATLGNIATHRGPLTDIANRVSVMYTPIIDDGTNPPITGTSTETVIVEDLDSQERFGIWERVVSVGNVLDAEAEYIRDVYLEEHAYPGGDTSVSVGGSSGEMKVSINCRGYNDWLSNYVYNLVTTPTSIETDEKIRRVLAADPNSIFSTSYDEIEYNGVLTPSYENENRLANTIIDSVVVLGGASDERWLFGVYGKRKCKYQAASQTLDYYYYVADARQRITTVYGETVQPWDVKPGKWAALPDYLPGASILVNNVGKDPRTFLIEQVDFTAPSNITINGRKVSKLSQYMAKLGLGDVT